MFMRIYWSRIEPGSWPDVEATYRELNAIPVPGMQARWVTQDARDPDSLFTVTLWDSAEDVSAWEASDAYRDVFLARVRRFMVGSHTVSLCEIKVAATEGLSPARVG